MPVDQFPNESAEYRQAREKLLKEEKALRQNIESVARLRRELPLGGLLGENYLFETATEAAGSVSFAELFAPDKSSLVIYSFMFAPGRELPCPSCSSILDGLDGIAPHAGQRINLAVVARAPAERLRKFAAGRGWRHLRLLSSLNNSYNRDYHAELDTDRQMPMLNVFTRREDGIFHTYGTELLYAESESGQEPRHVDLIWPLWNLFDLTPQGRGEDWHPGHDYL